MLSARQRAAAPFVVTGGVAIIVGGLVTAIEAHHPVRPLLWMAAYLVLVVGVAQILFGGGQAALSQDVPGTTRVRIEWIVFNLGNLLVIGGTLLGGWMSMVVVGTLLFVIAIGVFLVTTRGKQHAAWLAGYRVVLGFVGLSSLVGIVLTLHPIPH